MARALGSLPRSASRSTTGELLQPPPTSSTVAGAGKRCLWIAAHLPDLTPHASSVESDDLRALAATAFGITPVVSLEPPADLLIEVAGSLRLFGGLAAVRNAFAAGIESRRLNFRLCAAPTALASLWLARAGREDVLSMERVAGSLGPLSLAVTGWPDKTLALLREMGVRTIGDCLRLPRDGFARRAGTACLLDLDRALGRQYHARSVFELPERLSLEMDLPSPGTDRALLATAAGNLLERLVVALRDRQAVIPSCNLVLHHLHRPPTSSVLSLTEPTHERQRLADLMHDRLERLVLPAPVIALALQTGELQAMHVREASLFGKEPAEAARGSAARLLERLRGRFSAERVHGLALVAEHRPERAWTGVNGDRLQKSFGVSRSCCSSLASRRPLWMLRAPRPLRDAQRSLIFLAGPERITGGWWDGMDVDRDYYTVTTARGDRLWVYQQRIKPHEWYLHGLFG